METLVSDPDRDEPPTLADVRSAVRRASAASERLDERLHPQQSASVLDEIDELVEEFGPEAPAIDFVAAKGSEGLSRIIETVLSDARVRRKATLSMVRDEMTAGLVARLVGDGTIDADEDQTLLAEIEGLIERHGEDAVAEDFIRFE
jgi:hypothetical protein